jgi:hypothetical protein
MPHGRKYITSAVKRRDSGPGAAFPDAIEKGNSFYVVLGELTRRFTAAA